MRVPAIPDGSIIDAERQVASPLEKARQALVDLQAALASDGAVVRGLDVSLSAIGFAVSAGAGWDGQGRPLIAAGAPLSNGTPARPAATKWRWIAVVAGYQAQSAAESVYDLDGVESAAWVDDGLAITLVAGADGSQDGAVRPAAPADAVVLGDVLIDSAAAWSTFTVDVARRPVLDVPSSLLSLVEVLNRILRPAAMGEVTITGYTVIDYFQALTGTGEIKYSAGFSGGEINVKAEDLDDYVTYQHHGAYMEVIHNQSVAGRGIIDSFNKLGASWWQFSLLRFDAISLPAAGESVSIHISGEALTHKEVAQSVPSSGGSTLVPPSVKAVRGAIQAAAASVVTVTSGSTQGALYASLSTKVADGITRPASGFLSGADYKDTAPDQGWEYIKLWPITASRSGTTITIKFVGHHKNSSNVETIGEYSMTVSSGSSTAVRIAASDRQINLAGSINIFP